MMMESLSAPSQNDDRQAYIERRKLKRLEARKRRKEVKRSRSPRNSLMNSVTPSEAPTTQSGTENNRRWSKKDLRERVLTESNFKICFDLCGGEASWDKVQTDREIVSLVKQLEHCCSLNKKAILNQEKPVSMHIVGMGERVKRQLETSCPMWTKWPVTWKGEDFLYNHLKDIIYLSYDSAELLGMQEWEGRYNECDLDPSKVYVIGGLVDRNRLKGAAQQRATYLVATWNSYTFCIMCFPNFTFEVQQLLLEGNLSKSYS
ncbi:uncharacterized protein Gasu_39350 [Galdieria sulphuraria]|uniref:tRNA (guanine(9)-N(1))-methyltransferase n=1 Tax=Galdieria sulphuraria TaxID=130081 RepID=M2XEY6_GALSU|nr:uncharacterized protein Gasu_39350 [Galdieria sulphuraria]EME28557.1 hypothetical protein Gasu_39350 [Galdieria sulphuraria]|eukprot:XP_005705077.1 hypothetical protein Gasu_39350 [Galdieria sulphuraria]